MGSTCSHSYITYTDTNTEDCARIVEGMYNLVGSHIIDLYMPTMIQDSQTVLPFRPHHDKTCLRGFANNKGPDQPVHLRRLVSAFVIRLLENIISQLASSKISIF